MNKNLKATRFMLVGQFHLNLFIHSEWKIAFGLNTFMQIKPNFVNTQRKFRVISQNILRKPNLRMKTSITADSTSTEWGSLMYFELSYILNVNKMIN